MGFAESRQEFSNSTIDSAEECLGKLQTKLNEMIEHDTTLTFRPADGMIFWHYISKSVPVGVLYREGYQKNEQENVVG